MIQPAMIIWQFCVQTTWPFFWGWWVDVRDPNSKGGLQIGDTNWITWRKKHTSNQMYHMSFVFSSLGGWGANKKTTVCLWASIVFPTNFTWMHQVTKVTTTWLHVMKPVKNWPWNPKQKGSLEYGTACLFVKGYCFFNERPYVSCTGIRYYPLEPYVVYVSDPSGSWWCLMTLNSQI